MPCLQAVFQGLYPAPFKGKGDAWHAALRSAQSVFLQHNDDGNPAGSGCGRFCRLQEEKAGGHGSRRDETGHVKESGKEGAWEKIQKRLVFSGRIVYYIL